VVDARLLGFVTSAAETGVPDPSKAKFAADVAIFSGVERGEEFHIAGTMECQSAEAAGQITKQLIAARDRFKQFATRTVPLDMGPVGLLRIFAQLAENTKIEAEGAKVVSQTALTAKVSQAFTQAIPEARAAALRAMGVNQMKQIGIALHNYHDVNKRFPAAVVMGPDGKTPHSWRVEILPYLEDPALQQIYKDYRTDEPWDSEHNKALIDKTNFFNVPSEKPNKDCGYFAAVGPGTMFDPLDKGTNIRQITDGTSRTIAIVEAKRSIPWTKPEDIEFDPDKDFPKLGGYFGGGFNALYVDGSVHFLPEDLEKETLAALLTRAGHEIIEGDDGSGRPKIRRAD
jgi:prepilin-type processing-associated H-X9-DG protein